MKHAPPPRSISRRAFSALATTAVLGLRTPLARAQTALKVTYLPTQDAVPLFLALDNGYFAQEGLAVQAVPSQGGAAVVPALMGGAYDIAYGNIVSTLLAQQQGLKLRVVAPGTKNISYGTPATGLLTRKADALKTGRDFEGKSIGVNTRNGVIWLFTRSWVKNTGGDPAKVSFKEVPFPQMVDALRAKQVDGIFAIPPFLEAALRDGEIVRTADPYTEVQPNVDIGHYFTTDEFFKKNPELGRKFGRALIKGVRKFNANMSAPEVVKALSAVTKMSPEVAAKLPLIPLPDRVYIEEYEKTMNLMLDAGMLRSKIDLREMVDPQVVASK